MNRHNYVRRQEGTCQDCGWLKPVRSVIFWLNGYQMRLCADCEREYTHGGYAQPALKAVDHA